MVILILGGFRYRSLVPEGRKRYQAVLCGMVLLVLVAVFYAVCYWEPVVRFKNSLSGFLHYFEADRFYWLYPAGWYLEFFLCFNLWWSDLLFKERERESMFRSPVVKLLVLIVVLLPTLRKEISSSYFYANVKYIIKGTENAGYISWESYYAEDLMQELEAVIGRDKASYRIAHVGMSPAPALVHGFYTADGYSNNYPLEYKHRFRQIIAAELEKIDGIRLYFDWWGSRCYLFNGASGNAWMLGKRHQIVYEELDFDMEALKSLDCEYLFSCGRICNAEKLGLELIGYFETETSFWGVWLYKL